MWRGLKRNHEILQEVPQLHTEQPHQLPEHSDRLLEGLDVLPRPTQQPKIQNMSRNKVPQEQEDERKVTPPPDEWWKTNEIWPRRISTVKNNGIKISADVDTNKKMEETHLTRRSGILNEDFLGKTNPGKMKIIKAGVVVGPADGTSGEVELAEGMDGEVELAEGMDGEVELADGMDGEDELTEGMDGGFGIVGLPDKESFPEVYKMDATRVVPNNHKISLRDFDEIRKLLYKDSLK